MQRGADAQTMEREAMLDEAAALGRLDLVRKASRGSKGAGIGDPRIDDAWDTLRRELEQARPRRRRRAR